jgi:hypothetical protein
MWAEKDRRRREQAARRDIESGGGEKGPALPLAPADALDAPTTVLFCGSRDWDDLAAIRSVMADLGPDLLVVHGGARGADRMAGGVAAELGHKVRVYAANWGEHGKAAGPIRNAQMLAAEDVDLVVAFPRGESRGTWDMVAKARQAGIETRVVGPLAALDATDDEPETNEENDE